MTDIRKARLDELALLNALTGRSAMHWGYEPEFLDWEPESITLTAKMLQLDPVFVLEGAEQVVGYVQLSGVLPILVLDKLFIEPEFIGQGYGKQLWLHALSTARSMGATGLTLYSDPNAADFYRAMGARWIREVTTTRPGWDLHLFNVMLTPESPE